MGDAENQPSKKRAAGVQLSRDNPGLDDNEDSSELETGTFKRASEEVLASRRIVKVRRQQTSSTTEASAPSSASNPFAAIRLVPPTASTPVDKKIEQIANKAEEAEDKVDEPKGESTAEEEKTDDDNATQSEIKVDETKTQQNPQKDDTDDVTKQNVTESIVDEVAEGENTEDEAKKDTEGDNPVEGEENTEKNAETASFSSFQQLSSNQNAFSGLTGTGFSATSFSFGSIPKDGSPAGSATTSLFGIGASNNGNSSIFATSGTNAVVGQSEGTKFPEVSVETGEENEKAVFTADSVLFEYIDGAWKERGKGELKLNVSTTGTAKARLVMRARGNYRLILNASLFPDMKLTNMDKKGITFACVNSAGEGKDGLSTIALKFKDPSIVEEFKAAVMEHKDKTPVAVKTPENSPKASDE